VTLSGAKTNSRLKRTIPSIDLEKFTGDDPTIRRSSSSAAAFGWCDRLT